MRISEAKKSEHKMSSAKIEYVQFSNNGMSEVNMLYKIGDKPEPCGTPAIIWMELEHYRVVFTTLSALDEENFQNLFISIVDIQF